MKLSCRNYEKRRCWTRAGNIKRLAHNHMSLQSSNTVWKSHVKMINTHSEAGVNLEALYRPLQDTWSKPARLFRLCVSPRKILALLYTVMMMMMQKHLEKKKKTTKNQSWTSGSFFKVFFILFVNQKMKTDMAAVLSLCSIRKTCKTRRTLEKAHKTEWLTTVCPQMAREHPFTWIYKYRQWQHIQEEAGALSHHNKVYFLKYL